MNKYWLADAWNSDPSQISDAESYPKGTPFNTLKSDYFYIACYDDDELPPYVDVVILIDVVVVIDESASMADEQQFTKQMINGPCSRQFFDANPSIFHLPAVAFQTDAAGRRDG